jgi:predicted HD phosphohydrolase
LPETATEGSFGFGPLLGWPHRNSFQFLEWNAADGPFIGAGAILDKDRNGGLCCSHGMAGFGVCTMDTVKFTEMRHGDRQDYALLHTQEVAFAAGTADRLLKAMVELDVSMSGYKITRLGHSLQAASRAWNDGADVDWVVCALLHDIGDIYAPYNHDEYAATILRPFVREQCAWVVQTHGDFQMLYYAHHVGGNPNKREAFRGNPYFDDCAEFCERWDQNSFDPVYETRALEFFAPLVHEVFNRKAYDPAVTAKGSRVSLTNSAAASQRRIA